MKLTVSKSAILPILERCSSVADKRSAMPVLKNVLLHANGKLRCSATDLQQAVASDVDAKITETGSIALPARDLFERFKMLDGDVTMTVKGSAVTLKSGPRSYKMSGIPGSEFPEIPAAGDAGHVLAVSTSTLLSLMTATWFAVSVDECRPHLNGVALECQGGKLRMVSTDGHRLCLAEADAPDDAPNLSALIPLKALLELKRLCESTDDDTIRLTFGARDLFADVGGFVFSARLGDSKFVPYRQIIPESHTSKSTVVRASLMAAIRAVALAANDTTGGVKLNFENDRIVVEAEGPASGEGRDEVSSIHEGATIVIGATAKYLLDALGGIDTESVEITMGDELAPFLIRAVGESTVGGLSLVMPMKI